MKFLLFLLPFLTWSQNPPVCNSYCHVPPQINSIFFDEQNTLMTINGKSFPQCSRNAKVTFAGKYLKIASINETQIIAEIEKNDLKVGSYRVGVIKTNCPERYCYMDATITHPVGNSSEFIKRQTAPFSVFPYSYAEVEVACNPDEIAISGGFAFSTWEIKLVSSYPNGRFWRFKIYNNENITSSQNEFFAICVR